MSAELTIRLSCFEHLCVNFLGVCSLFLVTQPEATCHVAIRVRLCIVIFGVWRHQVWSWMNTIKGSFQGNKCLTRLIFTIRRSYRTEKCVRGGTYILLSWGLCQLATFNPIRTVVNALLNSCLCLWSRANTEKTLQCVRQFEMAPVSHIQWII